MILRPVYCRRVDFPLPVFGQQLRSTHRVKEDAMVTIFHNEKRAATSVIPQVIQESEILLEELMSTHQYPFTVFCFASLIFGVFLLTNMLNQLQVATQASGRGVLRCIRFHSWISLLCLPAICGDIALLTGSHKELPPVLCGSLDVMAQFLWSTHSFRGLSIALSR